MNHAAELALGHIAAVVENTCVAEPDNENWQTVQDFITATCYHYNLDIASFKEAARLLDNIPRYEPEPAPVASAEEVTEPSVMIVEDTQESDE